MRGDTTKLSRNTFHILSINNYLQVVVVVLTECRHRTCEETSGPEKNQNWQSRADYLSHTTCPCLQLKHNQSASKRATQSLHHHPLVSRSLPRKKLTLNYSTAVTAVCSGNLSWWSGSWLRLGNFAGGKKDTRVRFFFQAVRRNLLEWLILRRTTSL